MKTRMKTLLYGLFALTITITSCETEALQGPTGPAGPMGEQGLTGSTGADGNATGVPGPQGDTGAAGTNGTNGADGTNGTNGTDGENGNANIMYSEWLNQDLTHQNFIKFKQMRVVEPKLTNAFLNDGGIVLAFFRFTTNAIHNLPYSHPSQQTIRQLLISPSGGGQILFNLESTDNTTLDTQDVEGINPAFNPQYKYVLIAGGTSLSGKSQQNFNEMTYYEVMDYLELDY